MKLSDQVSVKKIGRESILVLAEGDSLDFTKVISLNESAELLINSAVGRTFTPQEWAHTLQETYDIPAQTAARDADALIAQLKEHGLIIE